MLRVGHGVRNILNKEQCGGPRVKGSPLKRFPIPRRESEAQASEGCKARLAGSYHSWLNLSLLREASWSLDRVWEGKFYEVVWKPKPARGCWKAIKCTGSRARDLLADTLSHPVTLCLKLLIWLESRVQVGACFGRLFAKFARSFCKMFCKVKAKFPSTINTWIRLQWEPICVA